jgi:hypothetical protein
MSDARSRIRSRPVSEVIRIARNARVLRIAGAVAALLLLAAMLFVGAAAIDALLRFPAAIRSIVLAAIIVLLFLDLRRFVLPALRFRPTPTEIALRIERSRPELSGWLASAVEFELAGVADTNPLAGRAVADADERAHGMRLAQVLNPKPALLRVVGAIAAAAAIVFAASQAPETASIAVRRTLAPWSDAVWPARTAVSSLVEAGMVANRSKPFALRASLDRGDAERERIRARYRIVRSGVAGAWNEAALARQPSGSFERLVDADGDSIEFQFLTSDAETEVQSAQLVFPPAIVASRATIEPPEYARRFIGQRIAELGSGLDSRGVLTDPVLEGSSVEISLEVDRKVDFGPDASDALLMQGETQVRLAATGTRPMAEVPGSIPSIALDPTDPRRWMVRFNASSGSRVEIRLVDEHGISRDAPAVFAIETMVDRPPTAAMVLPTQDESVLADARIEIAAEVRDDLGLQAAGIQAVRRMGEESGDGMVFEDAAPLEPTQVAAEMSRLLELSDLKLEPGDALVLRAYSEDGFASRPASDGEPADTSRPNRTMSAPRTLRIVGEEEFERQIQTTLAGVRRDAMRADERQAKAREAVEGDAPVESAAELQGGVTEGIARAGEAIRQAATRLERNGRAEGSLADLVEQAADLAEMAERRSAEAAEGIAEAGESAERARAPGIAEEARRAAEAAASEARREATQRQEDVRAELEDLVRLLDRSEDAWIARRRLESLANSVRQLGRETDQAARESNGEARDELPPEARAALDALSSRQRQAAQEAEQVVAELKERAESLRDSDPAQAEALREAAEQADEGRVREELENASEETAENRLERSRQSQERASAALSRAMEELTRDRKVRAKELSRVFEELVDSIKRLITETDAAAIELKSAGAIEDVVGKTAELERSAMELGRISQNARGVAADARAKSREAARAARFIDAASTSLVAAAKAGRTEPYRREDAESSVASALESLEAALSEAEQAAERAEERAEEEKREELIAKYREFLEREVGVRDAAASIGTADGKASGRRELIESRRLGLVQDDIRTRISELLRQEEDIGASEALVEMHSQIEDALESARGNLSQGLVDAAKPDIEATIESLSAIVTALDETSGAEDEDPFGEQQQAGGEGNEGSGAPSGTVPPVAEIKLLRAMQESLAKRTRAASESLESLDGAARLSLIAELAARQQRILELGASLARKISRSDSGPDGQGVIPNEGGSPDPERPESGGDGDSKESPRDPSRDSGGGS